MNRDYWKQKALPWVSASVMVGGLLTACLLFFVVRVESKVQMFNSQSLAEYGLEE